MSSVERSGFMSVTGNVTSDVPVVMAFSLNQLIFLYQFFSVLTLANIYGRAFNI